jgi:hypothetical protein
MYVLGHDNHPPLHTAPSTRKSISSATSCALMCAKSRSKKVSDTCNTQTPSRSPGLWPVARPKGNTSIPAAMFSLSLVADDEVVLPEREPIPESAFPGRPRPKKHVADLKLDNRLPIIRGRIAGADIDSTNCQHGSAGKPGRLISSCRMGVPGASLCQVELRTCAKSEVSSIDPPSKPKVNVQESIANAKVYCKQHPESFVSLRDYSGGIYNQTCADFAAEQQATDPTYKIGSD